MNTKDVRHLRGVEWIIGPPASEYRQWLNFTIIAVGAIGLWWIVGNLSPGFYRLAGTPGRIVKIMWEYATTGLLVSDFATSAPRVIIPLLASLPVFVAGLWLATLPRWEKTAIIGLGYARTWPRYIMVLFLEIAFGFTSEVPIYATVFFVAASNQALLGFWAGRELILGTGKRGVATADVLAEGPLWGIRTRRELVLKELLPFALPQMFTAFFISSASSWAFLIFVERVRQSGLGARVNEVQATDLSGQGLLAHALIIIGISAVTWLIAIPIERRVLAWRG